MGGDVSTEYDCLAVADIPLNVLVALFFPLIGICILLVYRKLRYAAYTQFTPKKFSVTVGATIIYNS